MRHWLLALAASVVTVLALGTVASAHANYVRSNPASDARLVKPPAEVRIEFSEPPDPKGSEIQVLDTAGKRYDKNDLAPSGDPNGLKVSVAGLVDGGYLVAWTTTSAVDGHTTKGNFAFVIGNGPLPPVPDVADAVPPPQPVEIAGRMLSYAGIALGLGTAFFVLFVHSPSESDETRRESWLLRFAGGLVLIGSAALIAEQGANLPPRLGMLLGLRAFAGVVLAGVSIVPALPRMRPVAALADGGILTIGAATSDRPRRLIALASGLSAALTATLVAHATALGSLRDMALDFLHISAVSVWTGGVVALLAIVLLPAAERTAEQRRALGATVWRFSLTALVAVSVLVTAGTLQAFSRLVLIDDLYETPYGVALAIKIALTAVALAIGALNLLRYGPRLRAGLAGRGALLRDTIAETAAFVVIIGAAAFLTAFAPPAQASASAFDETHHVAGLRLEMLVASAQPGRNRYVLRVHQGLAPIQSAEKVAFRFTMVEHDMGEQELVATERAAGEYVAEGSPTAMFGTWRIQAIVRLTGREDVTSVFSFPVGASGQITTARVLAAGPYSMIVFSDPVQPQAGAPVTVYALVVDQTGLPQSGKAVRATFSGPATQAPVDAVEDPRTLGPGRYKVALAALDAGTWQITFAIGNEASATYSLDVSR